MRKTIDARGLDCPKPVMETKAAVDKGCLFLTVQVDNETAAANVTRFLTGQGFRVESSREAGEITVIGEKENDAPDKPESKEAIGGKTGNSAALLLLSDKIGAESGGLGDVLMKSFLGTVAQGAEPPGVIALMNEGVRLALPDRSTCDTLSELEKKGTRLLICGTCAKHFGITADIKIGVISNMFEINDTVFAAGKPVVIG